MEIEKNKEIEGVKAEFEKGMLLQMQNLRNVQSNAKELYEVQINRLKEEIKTKELDYDNAKALDRIEKNRLKDQVTTIENEIKHMRQKYEIELK